MRFAILPVEKEEYVLKQECFSSTRLAYFLSYIEQNFPEDIVYPWYDHEIIDKTHPDFVAIYLSDFDAYERAYEIAHHISQMNIPIVMLGDVITSIPRLLPEFVNVGIIGEGEEQLKNLFGLVKKGVPLEAKFLTRLQGIAFYSKGQISINDRMNFFSDIDSIKLTRRPFFTMPAKWYPSFITGRGLPFRNSYESGFNTPLRLHSPEKMMFDLIDILTFYPGANSIPVEDYLLLHDPKRFKDFCNMFKEASIEKYFKLEIKAKIYQLNEENLNIIRHILKTQELEIDFGSLFEQSSKNIRNPYVDLEQHLKILSICRKYDLSVTAKFLVNMPKESKSDIARAYWIIKNNHLKVFPELKIKLEIGKFNLSSEFWLKSNVKKSFDDINKPADVLSTYKNLKNVLLFNNLTNLDEIKNTFDNIKNKEFRINLSTNNFKKQQSDFMRYLTYQKILEILYSKDLLPDAVEDILHRMGFNKAVEKPEINSSEYTQMLQSIVGGINWSGIIDTPYLEKLIEMVKK
jgi:hypothetical protein